MYGDEMSITSSLTFSVHHLLPLEVWGAKGETGGMLNMRCLFYNVLIGFVWTRFDSGPLCWEQI